MGTLQPGASQLAVGEQQAVTGQGQLLTGANSLATGVGKLKTGATELNTALTNGAKQIPDPSPEARKAVAETLGAPVGLKNSSQATADSYGAGLAPFFLSLACWIGAYVLFLLVRPLSPRALAALQSPLRVALGGWLPPALFGAVQAVLVFTAVTVGLGIKVAHPWLTMGFLVLTSVTFVAILHALSSWFGAVGKFLGLVLMVIQLVSAGGTSIPEPANFLVEDAKLRKGVVDTAFDLVGVSSKPVDLVLAAFKARYGGLWVGGRVVLTENTISIAPNAMNRAVHRDLSSVELGLTDILSVEVLAGFVTKIIALGTPEHVVKLRCYGAPALADQIRALAKRSA